PRRGSLSGLETSIELVEKIDVGNGVGQPRRPHRIGGRNRDDQEITLTGGNRYRAFQGFGGAEHLGRDRLRLAGGTNRCKERLTWSAARSEFRVGDEALLLDNAPQEYGRSDDRHLVFDHDQVEIDLRAETVRPGNFLALRIEQNLAGRRVQRRLPQQGNDPDQQRDSDDRSDELPPAPYEAEYLAQVETLHDLVRVEDLDWRKMQHLKIRDCSSILRSPSGQSRRTVRETGEDRCLRTRTGARQAATNAQNAAHSAAPRRPRLCCDATSDSIQARIVRI